MMMTKEDILRIFRFERYTGEFFLETSLKWTEPGSIFRGSKDILSVTVESHLDKCWIINLLESEERIKAVSFSKTVGMKDLVEYSIRNNPIWMDLKRKSANIGIIENILNGTFEMNISTPNGDLNLEALNVETSSYGNELPNIFTITARIKED